MSKVVISKMEKERHHFADKEIAACRDYVAHGPKVTQLVVDGTGISYQVIRL